MDGKFVKNDTTSRMKEFSMAISHISTLGLDVHLMVEKPVEDGYIDKALEYGCTDITIHYEIENLDYALNYLLNKKKEHNNLKIGIAIKPNTNIDVLQKYINAIDKVLVM